MSGSDGRPPAPGTRRRRPTQERTTRTETLTDCQKRSLLWVSNLGRAVSITDVRRKPPRGVDPDDPDQVHAFVERISKIWKRTHFFRRVEKAEHGADGGVTVNRVYWLTPAGEMAAEELEGR